MGVNERISNLEKEVALKDMKAQTDKDKKKLPWWGKFRRGFNKKPETLKEKVIVVFLNAKREVEEPVVVPIISGGIIVYRDKGYRFDPTALYTVKVKNRINKVLFLREIDRFPLGSNIVEQVTDEDFEELRKQGRVPFNDPILLKMLWNAQIEKIPKKGLQGKAWIWVVLGIIAVIVVYMFMK